MSKQNLMGYTVAQMESLMVDLGQKPFKGRQLFKWLYKVGQYDFDLMTDLKKDLRDRLTARFRVAPLQLISEAVSADGTRKYLFKLDDDKAIESVLIPDDESGRKTVCISSQAGCAMGCRFCATGTLGLLRNLTVEEIVGQIAFLRNHFGHGSFSNVVLMGMGEPLHNYANVVEGIRIITDELGMDLSSKRITVSTCGISPKIRRLAQETIRPRLAISLNAATEEKRAKIMPVTQTHSLQKLMEAVKYYTSRTNFDVTFEYILFDKFNDTKEDVVALARLVRGIPCMINVLAYNPVDGLDFKRPTDEKLDWFGRMLNPKVPAVTIRRSRGVDIDAACGQLAGKQFYRREENAL